ncbi:SusC/RagA family TonB-linked outer membrane protein [Dysgonomonas sp. Marseille-P4361]|uniref:SusC/RagA family TonB-linked outer membrane protein n=1 Tax=Dysgonomonas sp. Marseille-P4361 TaxID=2161820 RepID=UPI000D556974|nr:SusC/RagA family TonB-linked outer membrane protein [Dysgonomonas sp. Marseille-P4361]
MFALFLKDKLQVLASPELGGSPNRTATVQLRGVSSLEGSNDPLFIIDGIPGGSLELVRPEDIASIEVLKDGSAAAIYGSRASGGVIIITTKQGAAGKTSIEYNAYVSHYAQGRKLDFLNAKEYLAMKDKISNPSAIVDLGADTDWYGELLNTNNMSQSHNLSLSGGAGSTTYRASLFYSDSESIAKSDARKDYGGRVSLITKGLNEMLTLQTNLAATYSNLDRLNSDNRVWETALKFNPTAPIRNEDGTFWEHDSYPENVVACNEQQYMKRDQQYTSLDARLTLEPIKDLRFAITGGVVSNEFTDGRYYNKANRVSVNRYNGGGYAYRGEEKKFVAFAEPTVSYLKTFADTHRIDAVVGYSYRYNKEESFNAWNTGFISDAVGENSLQSGSGLNKGTEYMGMESKKEEDKLIAFFGRLNYVFDSRYIAQVSLRREGSTKFGANHRWGNFPSASLAWNITNEEFMKAVPAISNMKLRVGYGETGQAPNKRYEYLVTVGSGGYYLKPDGTWTQTYGPGKNPNPDLKWETKKEWNLGLDFGVLNNRLTGAIDFYKRGSSDLIIGGVAVPSPSNVHSSSTLNIGETENTGIEVTLQAIPVNTKDLRWKAFFTYSHLFSNKLTKYKGGTSYKDEGDIGGYGALGKAIRMYEGGELGQFYGRKFAGFDENGEWLFYKKDGSKVSPKQITEEDLGYIGNGVPKHHLSLTNMIDYKNFDFTISFKSRLGFQILIV